MANILDVDTQRLIESAAQKLKQNGGMDKPKYVEFVKSGASRERPPQSPDFWYMRCASVLRQVYLEGPIGVSKLRTRYGSRVNHRVHRHHHARAGGSIIKDAFDALEKKGYVKKGKKGRVITSSGKSFLDKVAGEVSKGA